MAPFLVVVLAALLAGCSDGLPQPLEATAYRVTPPAYSFSSATQRTAPDAECPDGRVHRVELRAPGLTEEEIEEDVWRFVWDDGRRSGVAVENSAPEPHRGASEPALLVYLGACAIGASTAVERVELQDGAGRVIGSAKVPPR